MSTQGSPHLPSHLSAHLDFGGFMDRRLHLGVTGSVAAFKALDLLRLWTSSGVSVSATLTDGARRFVTDLSFAALGADPVYGPMFSGSTDRFDHLAPGREAQAMVVAPATANTIAKLACGLADDMLACQALSFDGPLVVAPAMNPRLWDAPATHENWQRLKDRGVTCLEPESGLVACGDQGRGRLPSVELIHLHGLRALSPRDMSGMKVLVGLGPTREHFDCVRFWSNPSSGSMGAALAVAAWLRGADVTAVCGPVDLWLPPEISRIDVVTAKQMFEACLDVWSGSDLAVMAAAVADFSPAPHERGKFKKSSGPLRVDFEPNADILAAMGAAKRQGQRLAGFAAESGDPAPEMARKIEAKHLDLIVGNDVTAEGSGFGVPTNAVAVLDGQGRFESWPTQAKTEVAWRVLDWMLG